MVNNTTNLERIGYISNLIPQSQQKTHFPETQGVGLLQECLRRFSFLNTMS